jgi:nitric oxide synthase-interacting protein
MPRKSKNKAGANAMFGLTKKEHENNGYGTAIKRYGTDAQTKFGWCSLGLQPARTPVCSPSGVVYDHEAIIEYLLGQKMKLRQLREQYDLQQEAERVINETKNIIESTKRNEKFLTQNGNDIGSRLQAQGVRSISAEDLVRQDKNDTESISEKTTHIKRTNFWLPEATRAEVVKPKIKPPETCPRCPISGKALKSKHLITINFTRDNGIAYGEPGNIVCGVSKKAIVHQRAIVLKGCGHVILSSLIKTLIIPSMKCPLCNQKIKKLKDIIELKQSGSSYSGGGEAVVSSKYKAGVR